MPTWLKNRGIVVVTASTSMHSPLISGPLAAAQNMEATVEVSSLQLVSVASPGGCMWVHMHPGSTPVHPLKYIFCDVYLVHNR